MDTQILTQQHTLLRTLSTHATSWTPVAAHGTPKVTLNIALDGCIVPTESGGARVDYGHLVVLDSFIDEPTRQQLIDYLTEPGWTANNSNSSPPERKWEQATCDAVDAASKPKARTWGLTHRVLQQFAAEAVPAKLEVQSRLCKLYPDMLIAHMPSEHIQAGLYRQCDNVQKPQQQQKLAGQAQNHAESQDGSQQQACQPSAQSAAENSSNPQQQQQQQQQYTAAHDSRAGALMELSAVQADCSCFLANAAVNGDNFSWHVDADPTTFPAPSPWTEVYGNYCNREAGKPLFFSLLLYLDKEWPLGFDAETLFLDTITDTGIFVRPKAYRAVLMDQDVAHRLSAPSPAAGRPRYSLVWKLAMLPKQPGAACSLARPEWGTPTYFGSAAHVRQAAIAAAAREVPEGKARSLRKRVQAADDPEYH